MSPFTAGKHYRVKKTFKALRDSFAEGELLVYTGSVYSRYDGITGYQFERAGVTPPYHHIWDVGDEEPGDLWKQYFEPAETQGEP